MSTHRYLRPLAVAAAAVAATTTLMSVSTAQAEEAADCALFDDFGYSDSGDPDLAARGWTVRTNPGGPGVPGASWPAGNITFPTVDGQSSLRLSASTDGTAAGTKQAELLHQRKFHEGTYAARVRFTDAPRSGQDGDRIVETFFTITPLDAPNDPDYGELDFEYLPNGGWGEQGPVLFETTWETYQPDPWVADNIHSEQRRSHDGWRDLVVQVADGRVKYHVDGQQVADHGDEYYPETAMSINFNLWFIDLEGHTGGDSVYVQDVDWLYFAQNEVVAPDEAGDRVDGYRAEGVDHTDTVGDCVA